MINYFRDDLTSEQVIIWLEENASYALTRLPDWNWAIVDLKVETQPVIAIGMTISDVVWTAKYRVDRHLA